MFRILKRMICRSDIMNEYQFTKYVAYSREQNQPKQYVQNLLVRDATRIFDFWIKYEVFKIFSFLILYFLDKEGIFMFAVKFKWRQTLKRLWRTSWSTWASWRTSRRSSRWTAWGRIWDIKKMCLVRYLVQVNFQNSFNVLMFMFI